MSSVPPAIDGERLLAELGWVRALATRLVHDTGLAEDAAQDAWLLARERPPRTASAPGLRAWLVRVTHTLVRSRVRNERARERREAACRRPEDGAPAADEVVARTELQQRVVAAVMRLSEPHRSAILHKYVDGLSAREIAARQGTSEENVRQRVARGLAQLRRDLDHEFGSDGRAWAVALAGFLRDPAEGATATLIGGTLAMKSVSSVVAALAAAALVFVLVERKSRAPLEPRVEASSATEGLAAAAGIPADPEGTMAPPAAPQAGLRSEQPAAPGPSLARWRVRARLVDERGVPVANAVLAVHEDVERFSGRSRADGNVELEIAGALPIVSDESMGPLIGFVARAAGFSGTLRYEPPPTGDVLELGDVRLYPIGSLGGIVRDLAGRPIAGAEVRLTSPSLGSTGLAPEAAREHAGLFGPPYALGERRVTCDDGGRFVFEEVTEGTWRAWAGSPGTRWSASEPLRVERGSSTRELELVLEPLPEESLVRGLVRALDGQALADVLVSAVRAGDSDVSSWALSDANGRFVLSVRARAQYDLHARVEAERGEEPRHGPTRLDGVSGGGAEVVLVLPDARWLEVEVVDRAGKPLSAMVKRSHGLPEQRDWYPTEHSRARVLVPDEPFQLSIDSEGFVPVTRGPIEPATAPAELRILLEPLARVRGVVRSSGRAVADARVQLVRLARGEDVDFLYGFPARLDGHELVGTVSDERGRFELPIGLATDYALLAEKDGFPAGERGPLALDPARDETIDVELPLAGAVEGRVLVANGESPAGILVRLCRGDMRVHEGVTDAEGHYRIENLTPGPFMAEAQRKRAGVSRGYGASPIEVVHEPDFAFPWALEVRAGETVRHDIELAAQELGSVLGHLRVDGAAPEGASVRLMRRSQPWSMRSFDAEEQGLGRDGSFAFEPHRTEAYWLVFDVGAGRLAGTTIVCTLALERGENRVELELASAAVGGALPVGESGPYALVAELGPGRFAVTPIEARTGRFELAGVPAADSARLVARGEGAESNDPRTWRELARLVLPAGRRAELE